MHPALAALVCAIGILGLFLLDRDREARVSPALWLPVAWLAIGGSRNISVWLGASPVAVSGAEYLDGSPLDRAVMSGLIVMGLSILSARGRQTRDVLRRNWPLLAFFLYCAASITWSEFPFVALKRWTKVVGNLVMIFIVLTDPDPACAVKKFLTRTAFLLIPSSILLIKYYPDLGRYYDRWEGNVFYSGVTTDKNLLGLLCLVLGFGILSRFIETFRASVHRPQKMFAIAVVLAMNLWLFSVARSATSLACFIVGGALITVLSLWRRARPWMVHVTVGGLSIVAVIASTSQSALAYLVESFGRDTTLTGRTDLWNDLLGLSRDPWFGVGFESFFLGDRLEILWSKYWWHPNEAHNGYIETYLTLGFVGLCLLGLVMIIGYRNAIHTYRRDQSAGSLRLAFVIVAPLYNITEAAFKVTNPLWILFLLAVAAVQPVADRTDGVAVGKEIVCSERVPPSRHTPRAARTRVLRLH